MEEKVVLITGASSGIGMETAKVFARHHYNVIINYHQHQQEALLLKKSLEEEYSIKVLNIKCDIADENMVKQMVEESINTFGHIDVLVNNAGMAIDTPFEDKMVDNFRRILDVNLIGTFLVSKYVLNSMLKQKSGSIINVSSTNGIDTPYVESLDYDASKAGVISLTKNLAKAASPYVRVNAVAPGWVETNMNKEMSDEFKDQEISKIMLKRFGNPLEIANVIYFLSTREASYINNTVIRVDGGY